MPPNPPQGARRIWRARISERRTWISSSAVGARRHSRKCEPPGFVRNSAGLPLAHCAPPPTSALAAERRTAARPTGGIAALRPPATEGEPFGMTAHARKICHAPPPHACGAVQLGILTNRVACSDRQRAGKGSNRTPDSSDTYRGPVGFPSFPALFTGGFRSFCS